nr:HAMP domain-containing histidine kinase [Thermoflexales bacterium]
VQDYRHMRDQALAEARERRRAEEEVRQHAVELEARNADLDAFSHTVAHDLKAPLNLIQSYNDLILDYGLDTGAPESKQYLKETRRAVDRMNRIIREILLLSQVRKAEVAREPLCMSDIIDEARARLTDVIAAKQATLVLPDQWPVATGYGPWIEEVWANYLSNALKYGGQPPHLVLGADAPRNGQVRFWIKDNGQGLATADCGRLFTQFTRLDQVDVQGHGLGLSIVRRIIEKLGGEVGVDSELNRGSTFSFTLPVRG